MEAEREKSRQRRPTEVSTGASDIRPKTKADELHNRKRREAYHTDAAYRKAIKKRVKDAYYKGRPPPESPLSNGPIVDGQEVELYPINKATTGNIFVEEAYTIPSTAVALGKDPLTFKRWIKVGMVPPAYYEDVVHHYGHFLRPEVEILAEELDRHHGEYQYFREDHVETIRRIQNRIERYRRTRR